MEGNVEAVGVETWAAVDENSVGSGGMERYWEKLYWDGVEPEPAGDNMVGGREKVVVAAVVESMVVANCKAVWHLHSHSLHIELSVQEESD